MNDTQQKVAAKQFAAYWKNKGYEKGESQAFWLSLLRDVYGVEHPEQFITFEEQVHKSSHRAKRPGKRFEKADSAVGWNIADTVSAG